MRIKIFCGKCFDAMESEIKNIEKEEVVLICRCPTCDFTVHVHLLEE